MKFSGVQCLITATICVAFLLSFAVADEDTTKDVKVNSTELSLEESGRKIFKKKILCPLVTTPTIPDLSGISGLFSGVTDFLSEIGTVFTNIGFPALPDVTSLLDNTNTIISLKKLQLPAIFFLSLVVGAIAAGITLLIPKIKSLKPDKMMESMMDSIADMMAHAHHNVPAQYGAPELDSYPPAMQGGYSSQSQAYMSPDAYSLTYTGTGAGGQGATGHSNDQSFAAQSSNTQDSGSSSSSFFPSGQGQGQSQGQGQAAAAPAPATAYNAPSSSYTDPSSQYGAPVKRYNTQPYPSLASNYLRTAKSQK